MQIVRNAIDSFLAAIVSVISGLFLALAKSLVYAPIFYFCYRWNSHTAPPIAAWYGFSFAAIVFSQLPLKRGKQIIARAKEKMQAKTAPFA